MRRQIVTTLLAAAMAVTTLGAPARANGNDIVTLLAGATTLFIIGKALSDDKARAAEAHDVNRVDHKTSPYFDRNRSRFQDNGYGSPFFDRNRDLGRDRDDRRDWKHNKWHDKRDHGRNHGRDARRNTARRAPEGVCRITARTDAGTVSGYDYSCIQRFPQMARAMPDRCVTAARTSGKPRFLYPDQCLERFGFGRR